jgi:hypothetical protein
VAGPRPPLGIGTPQRPPASTLLVPRQLSLLTQTYLEEHQEHDSAETEGDQRDGEHLARQSTDQGGADQTSHDEGCCRPERQDSRARSYRLPAPPEMRRVLSRASGCAARGEIRHSAQLRTTWWRGTVRMTFFRRIASTTASATTSGDDPKRL